MTHSPRLEIAGGLYHLTTRAPKGLVLFRQTADGEHYLDLLGCEVRQRGWSLRTYCLMRNHVHLLLMTPEADLGDGMKAIHERFARDLHLRYDGHGHVFGGPFKNPLVTTRAYEIACLRYIALNPVKAGICTAPEDYRWSAHRSLAGLATAPAYLDIDATRQTIDLESYLDLTGTSDALLLQQLKARAPLTWIAEAVDLHRISITAIAEHLGVHRATAYKRLKVARDSRVRPPSRATGGSDPRVVSPCGG